MIRVHLLDPDYWRRRGLAAAVAECVDMEVCEDATSANVVLVTLQTLNERGAPGLDAPLLAYGEEDCPRKAAEALASGAHGYFALSSDPSSLRVAIETVSEGRVWALQQALSLLAEPHRETDLDPQQVVLLALLNEGLTNKEIGQRVGLAEATVKARLNRLYRRFGVTTRLQLLAAALRSGVIRS